MGTKFTQSFKIQAVEKALERAGDITVKEIANDLGVGHSTLGKWILLARQQKLESPQDNELPRMTTDKRPQDWSAEEKLEIVIACASLDEAKTNELCRERGIFLHHLTQWKLDFIMPPTVKARADKRSKFKDLRKENKALKKELNRKDKALAETAALLVLQKKVNEIWGSSAEGDSQ